METGSTKKIKYSKTFQEKETGSKEKSLYTDLWCTHIHALCRIQDSHLHYNVWNGLGKIIVYIYRSMVHTHSRTFAGYNIPIYTTVLLVRFG